MKRFIDADKLYKEMEKEKEVAQERVNTATCMSTRIIATTQLAERDNFAALICLQPTADVVEVRHGTWYHGTTESGLLYAECSACGRKMNYTCYGYAYCALCGARMDGERREG